MSDHRSSTDALILFLIAQWREDGFGKYALIAAAVLVAFLFLLLMRAIDASDQERLHPKVQKATRPDARRGGYSPRGPLFVPLVLNGVTIDLQPKRGGSQHCAVLGPTGLGKSSAVLSLFDLDIAVVAIALDNTRPLSKKVRSIGGWDWTNDPRQCSFGLDLLNVSTPSATAELVVSGLPKFTGDSGQWRRAAIARLTRALQICDAVGEPRTWLTMLRALRFKTGDVPADLACYEWASKLEQVYSLCGQNFGPDLNLVNAIRNRQKVVLRTNHFLSTEVGPMVGGWLMLLARLAAHEANTPFVLIVEEANQAEIFAKYISPVAQAARDRDVVGVWIGQNGSKLPDEVTQNTKVWVCSGQVLQKEQRFCADMLKLDPEKLDLDTFPKTNPPSDQGIGWFYVRAPGLRTTLVHLKEPTYAPVKKSPLVQPGVKKEPGGILRITRVEPDRQSRIPWPVILRSAVKPRELAAGRKVVPGWIERNPRRREIWDNLDGTETEQGCQLWTKGRNKEYGKSWYLNVGGWQTHFLFWAWKVIEDHEQCVPGDLERFYGRNPDVPPFEWPVVKDELVLLRSLKQWMQRPDESRDKLSLSIDHCCPGFPNALCGNWRHHQLVADEPGREGSNSKLRQQRRKGLGRLAAELG
jgi:hypothetical protein